MKQLGCYFNKTVVTLAEREQRMLSVWLVASPTQKAAQVSHLGWQNARDTKRVGKIPKEHHLSLPAIEGNRLNKTNFIQ